MQFICDGYSTQTQRIISITYHCRFLNGFANFMTVSHICKSVRDSGNHDNKFRAGPGKNFNFIMMAYFRSDLLYAPSNFTYLELDKSNRVALFNVFRRNPNGTVNYISIPTILAHRTCHTLDSRQNFLFQPLRTRNTQVFFSFQDSSLPCLQL